MLFRSTYFLTLADDAGFAPGSIFFTATAVGTSTYGVPSTELPLPEFVYWSVKARNKFGFERDCTAPFSTRCYMRGDMTAAYGTINIADLTFLVSFLFKGGPAPVVSESSNVNCAGTTNVSDLTFLVNCLFKGGPGPYCP